MMVRTAPYAFVSPDGPLRPHTAAHSGTSSGKTQLWDSKKNLESTAQALRFLTRYLAPIPHVVGLQLMNEPKNNQALGGWYDSTLRDLRAIAGPWFPL